MNYIELTAKECMIDFVKKGKIKTIHVNSKEISFQNIEENINNIYQSKDITMSRKYLPLFLEHQVLEFVYRNYIKNPYSHFVLLSNNKLIDFNITSHARKQFIKRLIACCVDDETNHVINKNIQAKYEEHKNNLFDILKTNKFKYNDYIDSLIKEFIIDAKLLRMKNITHLRDKRAIKNRNKKFKNTVRYTSHPFLFIIEDHILKTIELFSSTVSYSYLNKITSSDVKFQNWLETKQLR